MTTPTTISHVREGKPTARELLAEAVKREADSLLTIGFIMDDLDITRWLFNKAVRPSLPIIRVSARGNRVRRSVYEAWKAARTKPAMGD